MNDTPFVPAKVLDNKTVVDISGLLDAEQLRRGKECCIYVEFLTGVTAGVIEVEGAHRPDFAGTWASIGTVSWAAGNRVHRVAITGVHAAVRVRITTTVSGGAAPGANAYAVYA